MYRLFSLLHCSYLLFFFFFQAEDGIRDLYVTGVQTCALPICCRDPQHTENLLPRRGCRASGKRDRHGVAQQIAEPVEATVHGSEFVAPFHDAMRLVHGEERDRAARVYERSHERREAFGGAVQDPERPAQGGVQDHPALLLSEQAVQVGGRDAATAQSADLILHQRDEGRDDEGEPGRHEGRDLKAEGLPGAGREHGEDVAPREQRAEHLQLMHPKRRMAEGFTQHRACCGEPAREGRHRPARKPGPGRRPEPESCRPWRSYAMGVTLRLCRSSRRDTSARTPRTSLPRAGRTRAGACDTPDTRDAVRGPRSTTPAARCEAPRSPWAPEPRPD